MRHTLSFFFTYTTVTFLKSKAALSTVHGFLDWHAASDLGVDGQTQDSDKSRDFFVAGKGSGNGQATCLKLNLNAGTTIAFNIRTTANTGKTFST